MDAVLAILAGVGAGWTAGGIVLLIWWWLGRHQEDK